MTESETPKGKSTRFRVHEGGTFCPPSSDASIVYGSAWSRDAFEIVLDENNQEQDNRSINPSSVPFFYLATCGGRDVSIYKVPVSVSRKAEAVKNNTPSSSQEMPTEILDLTQSPSPPQVKPKVSPPTGQSAGSTVSWSMIQSYYDDTVDEDYYCCTFAGRSGVLDQQQTNAQYTLTGREDNRESPARKRLRLTEVDVKGGQGGVRAFGGTTTAASVPLLCVGGYLGVIHVLDLVSQQVVTTLQGHGHDIYDVKTSPTDEWIVASASRDHSIRLWDLQRQSVLRILAGHWGHEDSVISIDFHLSGSRLVSGGYDRCIKIWEIPSKRPPADTVASECGLVLEDSKPIKPPFLMPIFSTDDLHFLCVDCVQFVGDLIASKSTESRIELWAPLWPKETANETENNDMDRVISEGSKPKAKYPPAGEYVHLRSFHYKSGDAWYVRFAVSPDGTLMAVGDTQGFVYLWEIDDMGNHGRPKRKLSPVVRGGKQALSNPLSCAVRSVQFSPDGSTLVSTRDSGAVSKWNITYF